MNIEILKKILQEVEAICLQMKCDNDKLKVLSLEAIVHRHRGSLLEAMIDELNPKSDFKPEPKSDAKGERKSELHWSRKNQVRQVVNRSS